MKINKNIKTKAHKLTIVTLEFAIKISTALIFLYLLDKELIRQEIKQAPLILQIYAITLVAYITYPFIKNIFTILEGRKRT